MKPIKLGLRIWFIITSAVSFLAGWMLLAHAGKPAPLFPSSQPASSASNASSQLTPLPTLPPLPSLNDLTSGSSSLQSLPSLPSTFGSGSTSGSSSGLMPFFRSRGS